MEFLNFLKWQWNKWQFWQKCYIFGAFLLGAGVVAPEPYSFYLFAVPVTMLVVWTGKWMLWDQAVESWNTYKKEKSSLFDTIREGKQQ